MVRACVFATLALAACRTEPATPDPAPAPSPPPAPPAPAAPVTLTELTAGDRGCYVTVTEASGEAVMHLGDFALCEDTSLVGKQVRLVTAPTAVQAESCQGNPECAETETVDLVTELHAAE